MHASRADRAAASAADLARCGELLASGSRSFHAAARLLPGAVRAPATALYAFCRLADDAIDESPAGASALAGLSARLESIYSGAPAPIAADRAFAEVVRTYRIPQALPQALLEGFAWDGSRRQYATLEELTDYAARVAGSVGAMMALIMGADAREVLACACDLGVAMQFTNIARDVGEDAAAGRLYLPREWLAAEGIDAGRWLERPVFDAALGRVVARLLDAADRLYERAAPGIAWLPFACRPGMHAAGRIYAEIGREVARHDYDSVSSRAHVSPARKARLIGRAVLDAIVDARAPLRAGLDETRFLVEAAAHALAAPAPRPATPGAGLETQLVWVLDLFERLERRDRAVRERRSNVGALAS
jgi:15-cis-phytoene synthase